MTDTGHHLQLQALSKHYGAHAAVDTMTLDVARGEMVVLLGPSGCGKTTTLRLIAGFVQPTGGDILVDGRSIVARPPHKREMGIVFQSYALFPHLTVARNVAFGLEMRKQSRPAITRRVDEMLRLVKLEAYAHRLPRELSGGQQQRVALARALAIQPQVLLLDEPLSNLDAALRQEVARDIRILQRDGGLTAIMVTHDQDEAMAMADRLVVMQDGQVQQIGQQQDLYERPATPFVARFIGRSNILTGTLHEGSHLVLDNGMAVALAGRYRASGPCTLAIRPERISLVRGGGLVAGRVELATYLGSVIEHVVEIGPDLRLVVRNASDGADPARLPGAGEAANLNWTAAGERVFDAAGNPAPPG
jgi:putative spermidine/putrescine transport system ATP-binding protein